MRPAASTVALLAMAAGVGMGAPVPRYAVIFDAGSTGTRVHVYAWRLNDNASPTVSTAPSWSEKVSPGISSFFPENEAGAGDSILPLLAVAERVVPALERARCIVMLRATAGMRLIPRRAQAAIYDSLHNTVITRSGFRPARADFATLSGSEEGIFGWLATNHLLVSAGLLSASRLGAVGAIDLGGGSTQAGRHPRVCSSVRGACVPPLIRATTAPPSPCADHDSHERRFGRRLLGRVDHKPPRPLRRSRRLLALAPGLREQAGARHCRR